MKKILYISGTRADFGLMENVLSSINANAEFEVTILATGMHFMAAHGNTIDAVRKTDFNLIEVPCYFEGEDQKDILYFGSELMREMTNAIQSYNPDAIMLLGDRIEMLIAATVGLYLGKINIHFHGGDISGTVDEIARHAITKLSHIHMAASAESKKRIIKMGENPENTFMVGAPGLSNIQDLVCDRNELINQKLINPDSKNILLLMHPDIIDAHEVSFQINETLKALLDVDGNIIVLYPNADPGTDIFQQNINAVQSINFKIFTHLERKYFISLMKYVDVMVGNSSAGIIEAGAFGTPIINIGGRQKNRESGPNVIDVRYDTEQINKAILKAFETSQSQKDEYSAMHPYGTGGTAEKVIRILTDRLSNKTILQKQITY